MESTGDRPDDLAQAPLDAGVDVLIGNGKGEIAVIDLREDLPESALECRGVLGADDPLLAEHAGVRDRPADILAYQAHVERDRGVERLEATVGCLSEPSAPRLCRSHVLGHACPFCGFVGGPEKNRIVQLISPDLLSSLTLLSKRGEKGAPPQFR
jgi:hypothetical protein